MSLRESFKEHYLFESARRNELTSALGIPVAILTAVFGALAVITKELHAPLDNGAWAQLAVVVLGALASALCTYFLFRSLYGLAYAYVPTPQELSQYNADLALYYLGAGMTKDKANLKAENDTLDYLYSEYAKNAHRNATNNDIKSSYLHNANSSLIAAVILTATAGASYVAVSVASPSSPTKVEVLNMPSFTASSPFAPVAASTPPPPPPAARPEPPPSRVVREHRIPSPPPPPPPRR